VKTAVPEYHGRSAELKIHIYQRASMIAVSWSICSGFALISWRPITSGLSLRKISGNHFFITARIPFTFQEKSRIRYR